ncbi:MAG: hypothetical protein GY851_06280, partial [bacterium]|nr:hypothetical protein [bacterium]
ATWESFRYAKRLYSRMGYSERIELLENDAKHNYNQVQREGGVRWLVRWLQGRDETLTEPEIELLTDEEIWASPKGQVMLMDGARTTYDINAEYERELAEERAELWANGDRAELLDQVRALANVRGLDELGDPTVSEHGIVEGDGYRVRKLVIEPEKGIYLPALAFEPEGAVTGSPVVYVHGDGMAAEAGPDGALARLAKQGRSVLAVDVRGVGETRESSQSKFGEAIGLDWEDVFIAYVVGRSYVGMRAEDIAVAGAYAGHNLKGATGGPVTLVAEGHVGVPALHAAALEPELFDAVTVRGCLDSWSNVVQTGVTHSQFHNVVHGALRVYDLPDLARVLGDKLTTEEPVDSVGKPAGR